ncbi:MAG: hypothetical protein ACLGI2_04960 [Acidimicrobiia bacterium]
MRRTIAAVVALLASAGAAPAWAHQEVTPATVVVGRPVFLTLAAANEKRVDVTSVTLTPSSGQQFGHATREPAGWSASLGHTRIAWTGGAIRPDRFEQFGFDIEPPAQPGALAFRVALRYADGTTTESDVQVTSVVAGDQPAPPTTTATTVAADAPASTEPDPSVPAPVATADDDGGASGVATLALIVAIAALASSVIGVVRGRDRSPTAAAERKGQDW